MTKPENALSRWSRLKRQSLSQSATQSASQRREAANTPPPAAEAAPPAPTGSDKEAPAAPFDVASLPPIESIVAGSDISAFLQKGVPAALTRAALRQTWVSDPAIRDFIEIAENQWDFTHPETIPGFGLLGPADEVQSLLAQALGELRTETKSLAQTQMDEGNIKPSPLLGDKSGVPTTQAASKTAADPRQMPERELAPVRALQHDDSALANSGAARKPRRHGGAMPS
jgi:hypothetical protein